MDKEYAKSPEQYTRAFLLLQDDLMTLFDYIEPADANLPTYSFRIHELLVRACMEVEANLKAILRENLYSPTKKNGAIRNDDSWTIHDYYKTEATHHLSSYKVMVPRWIGEHSSFQPFLDWKAGPELGWYKVYNNVKHDRAAEFPNANFHNLILSVTGLFVVLSAQFGREDFSPGETLMAQDSPGYYGAKAGIGGFFGVEFPDDWTTNEMYEFDWSLLADQPERFQKYDYNK